MTNALVSLRLLVKNRLAERQFVRQAFCRRDNFFSHRLVFSWKAKNNSSKQIIFGQKTTKTFRNGYEKIKQQSWPPFFFHFPAVRDSVWETAMVDLCHLDIRDSWRCPEPWQHIILWGSWTTGCAFSLVAEREFRRQIFDQKTFEDRHFCHISIWQMDIFWNNRWPAKHGQTFFNKTKPWQSFQL